MGLMLDPMDNQISQIYLRRLLPGTYAEMRESQGLNKGHFSGKMATLASSWLR